MASSQSRWASSGTSVGSDWRQATSPAVCSCWVGVDDLHGIVGLHVPPPFAGAEVDRQEGVEVAHQHHVIDDQRMQPRKHHLALLLVEMLPLVQRFVDVGGVLHVDQGGDAPAHAEQRRAADGRARCASASPRNISQRSALAARPAFRATDQPPQPGHGVGVLVEPVDLPAPDGRRQLRPPRFQGDQRPLRLLGHPASSQPAAMASVNAGSKRSPAAGASRRRRNVSAPASGRP